VDGFRGQVKRAFARRVGSLLAAMSQPSASRRPAAEYFEAAAAGALVLGAAALMTVPSTTPFAGHGHDFALQSADPLSLTGAFPQRILWPLLAWATGLEGGRSPIFSQVCNWLLLATVFWFCRRRGAVAANALLITLAVGLTGAVQLYQVLTCHSDTLNWVLMLLLVHHVSRPLVFWPLVLLTALSHEMIFFFAPWLLYVRREAGGRLPLEIASLAAVVAIYQGWRLFVKGVGKVQGYDVAYYLHNHWLPWGTPGLWLLWIMLLLVEFGPLLAVIGWAWRTDRLGVVPGRSGRWGPWLYLACTLSLMVFAYDVHRFASYAFLPLVLGSLRFLELPSSRPVYVVLLGATVVSYVAMHWVPLAGGWVYHFASDRLLHALHVDGVADYSRFFTVFLPGVWWQASCFAVAAAGIAALSVGLARRFPQPEGGAAGALRTNRSASP
jgi:hypothetical protein